MCTRGFFRGCVTSPLVSAGFSTAAGNSSWQRKDPLWPRQLSRLPAVVHRCQNPKHFRRRAAKIRQSHCLRSQKESLTTDWLGLKMHSAIHQVRTGWSSFYKWKLTVIFTHTQENPFHCPAACSQTCTPLACCPSLSLQAGRGGNVKLAYKSWTQNLV